MTNRFRPSPSSPPPPFRKPGCLGSIRYSTVGSSVGGGCSGRIRGNCSGNGYLARHVLRVRAGSTRKRPRKPSPALGSSRGSARDIRASRRPRLDRCRGSRGRTPVGYLSPCGRVLGAGVSPSPRTPSTSSIACMLARREALKGDFSSCARLRRRTWISRAFSSFAGSCRVVAGLYPAQFRRTL